MFVYFTTAVNSFIPELLESKLVLLNLPPSISFELLTFSQRAYKVIKIYGLLLRDLKWEDNITSIIKKA